MQSLFELLHDATGGKLSFTIGLVLAAGLLLQLLIEICVGSPDYFRPPATTPGPRKAAPADSGNQIAFPGGGAKQIALERKPQIYRGEKIARMPRTFAPSTSNLTMASRSPPSSPANISRSSWTFPAGTNHSSAATPFPMGRIATNIIA